MARRRVTTDAIEIIDRVFYGGRMREDPALDAEMFNAQVAEHIYALRTRAGLTQRQLAEKIGTSHSVISRLEDADYRGHSFSMLQRISAALQLRIELRFVPVRNRRRSA